MRSQVYWSHCRSVAGVFGMVVAGLIGVVIGGDLFERGNGGSGGVTQSVAPAKTDNAVLQDSGEWLSDAFWQRKRRQRLRSGGSQSGYFSPQFNPFFDAEDDARRPDRRSIPQPDSGLYRTVCVRLCDGYYFPISFSTTRSRFGRDEQVCQSQCSSEARLFYHSSRDPNAEDLRDRNGNRYEDLANAFVYRTTYDRSCQCRPEPWSEEARQRHASYAAEGDERQRLARGATGDGVKPVARTAGGQGQVETAAIPVKADADQSTPVGWAAPVQRPPRMSLGRPEPRVAPVRSSSASNRRRTNWRSRAFNALPDGS